MHPRPEDGHSFVGKCPAAEDSRGRSGVDLGALLKGPLLSVVSRPTPLRVHLWPGFGGGTSDAYALMYKIPKGSVDKKGVRDKDWRPLNPKGWYAISNA